MVAWFVYCLGVLMWMREDEESSDKWMRRNSIVIWNAIFILSSQTIKISSLGAVDLPLTFAVHYVRLQSSGHNINTGRRWGPGFQANDEINEDVIYLGRRMVIELYKKRGLWNIVTKVHLWNWWGYNNYYPSSLFYKYTAGLIQIWYSQVLTFLSVI